MVTPTNSFNKMRLCGKINPFFVATIFSFVPFYSLCLDHNTVSTEKHGIGTSHEKMKVTYTNSSTPSQLHPNGSVPQSTKNLTEGKSLVSATEQTSKPVISSSTTTNRSFKNENVHLKVDHTKKPSVEQLMEGGGTLPVKKTPKIQEKGLAKDQNSTVDLHDSPKTSLEPHKTISPRKGAPVELLKDALPPVVPSSTTTTTSPKPTTRKMKPMFTMVEGDKFTKESESFIESPTTGKDYVLPMVLIIFAVPLFVFLVKFLYKRGTEFTERQQYHRMYLIDGDYRTPFFERWGRFMKSIFWTDNLQTVNLTNFGDVSLNPRMNYHSF